MAEYEERNLDDLTEEPSQHRLDELRAKGQVAQSRELTSTIALLGVMLAMYFLSSNFISEFSQLLKDIFSKDLIERVDSSSHTAFTALFSKCGRLLVISVAPVVLAAAVLGLITSVAQSGFNFATEALEPDFERVNPLAGFMRLFSMKSVVDAAKSVLKVSVIGGAVYSAVSAQIVTLPSVVSLGVAQLLAYIGSTTTRIFGVVGVLLLATSALDYFIQWRRFRQQAMMTKQEAKQEHKEREGDPQVKARIRSIQREAARKRMMKSVPRADVVVTNPTHIAIAIIYDPEQGFAPRVIAKGGDYLAERIKKIAREHGIPTVENKPLARTLYKHVKVGQMIPRSLYQAVAEILAYVYKIRGKKMPTASSSTDGGGARRRTRGARHENEVPRT